MKGSVSYDWSRDIPVRSLTSIEASLEGLRSVVFTCLCTQSYFIGMRPHDVWAILEV